MQLAESHSFHSYLPIVYNRILNVTNEGAGHIGKTEILCSLGRQEAGCV